MKKALTAALAALMALSLAGCASVFSKTYFSHSQYESLPRETSAAGTVEVDNYIELTLAINNLVTEHAESAVLHFGSYEGEIADDLAAACREVSTETALGAYAVDYISYDLDRIVAYYEAEVFVYYKRTAEELESIVSVNTAAGLYEAIRETLASMGERLVAMVGASDVDEGAVRGYVDEAYFSDPLACVERPEARVNVYTGGGFQRIVELELDYGASESALSSRRAVIENTVSRLAGYVSAEDAAFRALQCAVALANECAFSEDAPGTLWSALIEGRADSEGVAAAFKAVCDAAEVECLVVEGRFERAEHYWNIITVDGESYHCDISRAMSLGFANTFLVSDSQMWGSYWWDDQDYPECDGPLTYASLTAPERPPETETPPPAESAPPSESPEATA